MFTSIVSNMNYFLSDILFVNWYILDAYNYRLSRMSIISFRAPDMQNIMEVKIKMYILFIVLRCLDTPPREITLI